MKQPRLKPTAHMGVANILVPIPIDLLQEIDAWRARQDVKPVRTKSILYFIREGMAAVAKSGEEK